MDRRNIGHTDLEVSTLAFGAMSLDTSQATASMALLRKAFDGGINYFDTADMYDKGNNEHLVGEGIRPFRKDVILATKVGNCWREDGSGWDWKASKSYILSQVDQSLRRLKTDYIDLYQLHGGTNEDDHEGIVEAFEELVQQGKIRYYGISSIRPNVFLPYAQTSTICSNMMQFSLLDRRPVPYLDQLQELQVSVVARGALAQGLLVDKSAKDYLIYSEQEVQRVQSQLSAFANEHGWTNYQVALGYVLSHQAVASAVIGVRNEQQLNDFLRAYRAIPSFDEMQKKALGELVEGFSSIAYDSHLY